MKNYIQEGDRIIWTNATGSDVAAGAPVIVNGRTAVATVDIANGDSGALMTEGVFEFTKETGKTFAQFDDVYWDGVAGKVTTDKDPGAATPAAVAGNTGTGTIGTVTVGATAKAGVYRAVCFEVATDAGKFLVEDPAGIEVGVATVGSAFTGGGLTFTIADATDFVAGDSFTITVAGMNTVIGYAFEVAGSSATTARVMIDSTIKH